MKGQNMQRAYENMCVARQHHPNRAERPRPFSVSGPGQARARTTSFHLNRGLLRCPPDPRDITGSPHDLSTW